MKRLMSVMLVLFPLYETVAQGTLSKMLWNRVNPCYSMMKEYNDGDEIINFHKVDDAKNGYLSISGGWPTCGCKCGSTVGAYKNNKGQYTFLQSDYQNCGWQSELSSNQSLKKILPPNLISHFTDESITNYSKEPIFFIDAVIPQKGTDTKIKLQIIPLGIKPKSNNIIAYGYTENDINKKYIASYELGRMAKSFQDSNTLNHILSNQFDQISKADQQIISKVLDDGGLQTKDIIRTRFLELKKMYDAYKKLDYVELILGWNKKSTRFYVKSKAKKAKKMTFKEFVIQAPYWAHVC